MPDPLRIDHRITIPGEELHEAFALSGGPGGQNVNKTASLVQLRFDARGSAVLPDRVRRRLFEIAGSRATRDGAILIESSRTRSQARNREDARERLRDLVREAAEPPPPPRRRTRPSRGAIERRLKAKAERASTKRARRAPAPDG